MAEEPLVNQSLGSQIADRMRQDIILGRLAPGQTLRQDALCAQYGTSRMPVRDALRILASEGLTTSTSARRVVVARLTVADLQDSFVVEALVHGRAARRATQNATAADLDELEALNEQMRAASEDEAHRIADLNWEFHSRINRLANSPKLIAVLRAASTHIPRDFLVDMPGWVSRSASDHEQILETMRRGDGAKVEVLLRAHVEEAGRNLAEYLVKKGYLQNDSEWAEPEAAVEVAGAAN